MILLAVEWNPTVMVIGAAGTMLGLALSLVQTVRYVKERDHVRELQRSRNANIWANMAMVLQAYDTLEDARTMGAFRDDQAFLKLDEKSFLVARISAVRKCIVSQYLQLLKEAVLDEPEFTLDTVEEWKKTGRLENEWRVAQAMKFVRTDSGLRGKEHVHS